MPLSLSASVLLLPLLQAKPASAISSSNVDAPSRAISTLEFKGSSPKAGYSKARYQLWRFDPAKLNYLPAAPRGLLASLAPGPQEVLASAVAVSPIGVLVMDQLKRSMHLSKPVPHVDVIDVALPPVTIHHSIEGIASWYQTYPGTCASLQAPRGTTMYITDLENGATTTCIVEDSGPYVSGRVIDLAAGVFSRISGLQNGLTFVRVSW